MTTLEERARELAWRIKGYPNQCAICHFRLAESADKGCVIGNCSYRPHDGSAEDGRVSRNRAELTEITGLILASLGDFEIQLQAEARERALEEAAQVCEKVARVTVSTGATPGCTADAIREAGKWKTFEQPAPPTLSVEQAHRWRGEEHPTFNGSCCSCGWLCVGGHASTCRAEWETHVALAAKPAALDEGAPTNAAYRIWNDLTEFIAFLGPLENKYKAIAAIQGRIVEMLNNEGIAEQATTAPPAETESGSK